MVLLWYNIVILFRAVLREYDAIQKSYTVYFPK